MKSKNIPASIKFSNGELIFAELIRDRSDANNVTFAHAYKVLGVGNGNIQLFLWNPFTDDIFHTVSNNFILSISPLNNLNKGHLGILITQYVIRESQDTVSTVVNSFAHNKLELLDVLFNELLDKFNHISDVYGVEVPPVEVIKKNFYTYVTMKMKGVTEMKQ